MVKQVSLLGFLFLLLGCDPGRSVGEKPFAPVMVDLSETVPLNEYGIRPDPNSTGIILDWEQEDESNITSYSVFRTKIAVGNPPEPYSFREIARFESGNLLTFVDTTQGINLDTTFYYKMKAYQGNNESDFSNIVSLKLIEKPIPNSPSGQNIALTPQFKWSLVSTSNDFNFTIRVREYVTKVPMWVCTSAPDDSTGLYNTGNQFIRYGTRNTLSNSTLEFLSLRPNTEYEWKVTLHSGFTPNGDGTVTIAEKKASTSKWIRFKTK